VSCEIEAVDSFCPILPDRASRDLISVMAHFKTGTELADGERSSGDFSRPVRKNVFAKKVFLFDRLRDLRYPKRASSLRTAEGR
jgi:hypothetical protein